MIHLRIKLNSLKSSCIKHFRSSNKMNQIMCNRTPIYIYIKRTCKYIKEACWSKHCYKFWLRVNRIRFTNQYGESSDYKRYIQTYQYSLQRAELSSCVLCSQGCWRKHSYKSWLKLNHVCVRTNKTYKRLTYESTKHQTSWIKLVTVKT